MKKVIISIYTLLYRLFHVLDRNIKFSGSSLWNITFRLSKDTNVSLCNATVRRSAFNVSGEDNAIYTEGVALDNCEIRINGTSNTIIIEPLCIISNSVIVVNGNNCRIMIGKSTRAGSMYMVCMGQDNYITVGKDCMIADNIDIWATDSHPIFNDKGEVCNPSKPVEIGNHVWLGKYAKVLKGVTIHDNAIIGMNAMVTKDVPEGSLAIGAPCKVVKTDINWSRDYIEI